MKNIIVCCDGTWNTPDFQVGTNVWKLYQAMQVNSAAQVKYYDTGVGTQGLIDKITGGLAGEGLVDNIFEAYRFICHHYEQGDKISIFGFSRGAYTARALSGVLGDIGVIQFNAPCTGKYFKTAFRTCFDNQMLSENNDKYDTSVLCSGCKATSLAVERVKVLFKTFKKENFQKVKAHIKAHNELPQTDHTVLKQRVLALNKDWQSLTPTIEMLGVWDTVSALGIPSLADLMITKQSWQRQLLDAVSNFLFKSSRNEYAFINNQLNPLVKNGYHALAVDERRDMFKPVLWDKAADPSQHIEQVWFIGAHSNVGGGYLDHALSDISLHWMMDKAKSHNILFDTNLCYKVRPDYLGLLNTSYLDGPFRFLPNSSRKLPPDKVIHDSVQKRIANAIGYIPENVFGK